MDILLFYLFRFLFVVLLYFSLFDANIACAEKTETSIQNLFLKKIKSSKYDNARKEKWIKSFLTSNFVFSPEECIEVLKYVLLLDDSAKKNARLIDALLSLIEQQDDFDVSCLPKANKIIIQLLDKYYLSDSSLFDKYFQLLLFQFYDTALGPDAATEKRSAILYHYIVEKKSILLFKYYLNRNLISYILQKYRNEGAVCSLRIKAYSFLNNQFLNSNDDDTLLGLLRLCANDFSLPFSFDLNGIKKILSLTESPNHEIQKTARFVLNKWVLHNKLHNKVDLEKIKIIELEGHWNFLVSLLKNNDYHDKNMLLAHLSYIVVFDKKRSNEMLKKYVALFLDKNCINNEISKTHFFFWLIGIAINSNSPTLVNDAFKLVISKLKTTGLGKGINSMGGNNLWLLCYAIPYLKGKIDSKDVAQYKTIIFCELMTHCAKGKKDRLSELELANSFYLLGAKKMAGQLLLKGLKNHVIISASDVQEALFQLEDITGMKCGINFPAWQKAIDAMPDDKVPAKKNKQQNQPPTDVTP